MLGVQSGQTLGACVYLRDLWYVPIRRFTSAQRLLQRAWRRETLVHLSIPPYNDSMVRRSLNKQINDAIRKAVEDVPLDLVTNWCKHIRVEQEAVSFVGQMTGLSIGPKRVECPYFSGWGAMTVSQAATAFVEANCHGCPHHEEVHANNIGRGIVERVAKRRAREDSVQAAHEELERLVPEDPYLSLSQDADCDEGVKDLAGLLTRSEHKQRAAASLLEVARYRPHLFGRQSAKVLQGAFFDHEVGGQVLEVVRTLGSYDREVLREAASAAVAAIERSVNKGAASALLLDAIENGAVDASEQITALLVDALSVPLQFSDRFGKGKRNGRTGTHEAVRRLATMRFDLVSRTARERLASPEDYNRAKGAKAAQVLLEVDTDQAIALLLDALIDALALEEEEKGTDATILETLAIMLRERTELVASRLFERAERFVPDVRATIIRAFRFDQALDGDAELWLPRLINYAGNEARGVEERHSIAETLSTFAYRRPQLISPHLEGIVGVIAIVSRQRDARRERKPAEGEWDWHTFMGYQGDIAVLDALLRDLRQTVVRAAGEALEQVLQLLGGLLINSPTEVAETFKGELLALVGEIGKEYRSQAPAIVPLVYPHLLNPKSPTVRSYAADACDDIVWWNRDALPDEVLVALSALLADEYLGPVKGAVRAFRRARLPDVRLAGIIVQRLVIIYAACRGDDVVQHDLLRDIMSAVSNMAGQHATLLPIAAAILANGAALPYFYTASDCLKEFGWFVRRHAEYQDGYLRSLISYYERFTLTMVLSGHSSGVPDSDDEFEMLYHLLPEVVRAHGDSLLKMGLGQDTPFNRVQIGLLLATVELPEKGADLFEAYHNSAIEPRLAYERDRYAALAQLLRGEAALNVKDNDSSAALFEEAVHRLSNLVKPRRRRPFGLDERLPTKEASSDPYLEWARMRSAWLGLPEDDNLAASEILESLAREVASLRETQANDEDDDTFMWIVHEIAEGARHVCLWYGAVRMADPDQARHMDAALARLADAAKRAAQSRWRLLAEQVQVISGAAEALTPAAGVRDFLYAVRTIPFPFPKFDMPVRLARRYRREQQAVAQQQLAQDESEAPPPVAFVRTYVDGVEAPQVTTLLAGQIHDLLLEIELPSATDGTALRIFPLSVLPQSAYDFSLPEIQLSAKQSSYQSRGSFVLKYSHASGSSPQSIKLGMELKQDGETQALEVFEHRSLTFRAVDKETFLRSEGEQPRALMGVEIDMAKLIPVSEDPHRREELSVIEGMLNYAAHHLSDPWFIGPSVEEKDFQRDLARHLWIKFDGNVFREVKAGRGFVDALVLGVPLELKVAKAAPDIQKFASSSIPQAIQYTVSQGRRVGLLAILDLTVRTSPAPRLEADVDVYPGTTVNGLKEVGPLAIVVFVIRGALVPPSALRP